MTIIWQDGSTTLADSPPEEPYNRNSYEGTIWINIITKLQYFGGETEWTALDPSNNMVVNRKGINLISDNGSILKLENKNGHLDVGGNPVPTLGIGTVVDMLALPNPITAQEFYTTNLQPQLNKKYIYSGRTWQSFSSTIELQCDEDLEVGSVVEITPDTSYTCRKCTQTRDKDVIGTIFQKQKKNDWATVCVSGIWDIAVTAGTYKGADYLLVDREDGLATTTHWATSGIFAQVIENKTIESDGDIVKAYIFPVEHF